MSSWPGGVRTIVEAVGVGVGRRVGLSVLPARRLTDVGLRDTTRAAWTGPQSAFTGEGGPSPYILYSHIYIYIYNPVIC